MVLHVGDTITLDEIEVYVLAAKDEDGTWNSGVGVTGVEFIGVDKNHDLSYYVNGSDWVNSEEYDTPPGTFGYEWGGYRTTTGIEATEVGSGLSNTDSLIEMNLQPNTSGWYVIWDKIKEFRETRSSLWFLPSIYELDLIYEARDNLSNLTTVTTGIYPYYWSSSEDTSMNVYVQDIDTGRRNIRNKKNQWCRSRLCRYITSSDLYTKKTWIEDELITATELNRIETRVKELHSSYESHTWVDDEVITAEKLNNIETQLGTSKTWIENELITDIKLNNIEDQLV